MSYSAEICFKTLKECKLYSFLQEYKAACKDNLEAIAKENCMYMPSIKRSFKEFDETTVERFNRDWAKTSVFTHRFFYLPEHSLLGMFNVPHAVCKLFDGRYYFQNSCDQDYEFEYWNGVPIFEHIANEWKNASKATIIEKLKAKDYFDPKDELDFEYQAKTCAYEEIWSLIENFLWDDASTVSISLFGYYEILEMEQFVNLCKTQYVERLKAWESDNN